MNLHENYKEAYGNQFETTRAGAEKAKGVHGSNTGPVPIFAQMHCPLLQTIHGLVMKNVPESNSTTAKEESSNGLFSGKDMPDEKAANLDSGATTAATSENEHNAIDVRF
uniref:Uncharacterized protein n=1 Tax=Ditylenchus dipsaci TaxID=166011 RepID=A0A915CP21_9BILA